MQTSGPPGGGRLPRWLGVVALLAIATTFGANHVAARLAFDNGLGVSTAVVVRSVATALFVLALLRWSRVSLRVPRTTLRRGLLIGALVSIQSICLYSAVARIPVALALLTFNTFPMMLGLVSWLAGGERPARRTLIAMPIALAGLAIALDAVGLAAGHGAIPLPELLPGVAFALGASLCFGVVLHLTGLWLHATDGRLRTLMFMVVVTAVTLVAGSFTTGFDWPVNGAGWLGLVLLTVLYGAAITGLFIVLPYLGAVNNAAIMNFEPVSALVLAWLVLDQTVSPTQLLGGAIVIGAIVYLSTGRR
jgi:drug/metabolite transporter (DMT)-like permease